MRILLLDGKQMTDKQRAHEHMKRALFLPPYYGKNLDALDECLSEMPRNTLVLLVNGDAMLRALGAYGDKLLMVLSDAAREGDMQFINVTE